LEQSDWIIQHPMGGIGAGVRWQRRPRKVELYQTIPFQRGEIQLAGWIGSNSATGAPLANIKQSEGPVRNSSAIQIKSRNTENRKEKEQEKIPQLMAGSHNCSDLPSKSISNSPG